MVRRAMTVPIVVLGTASGVAAGFREPPTTPQIVGLVAACIFTAAHAMITTPTLPTPKNLTGITPHHTLPYACRPQKNSLVSHIIALCRTRRGGAALNGFSKKLLGHT